MFVLLNLAKWVVNFLAAIAYSIWQFIKYFIMLKDITNDEYTWFWEWLWGLE